MPRTKVNGKGMLHRVPSAQSMKDMLQVGERIRELRMAQDLTQEELADRSNLTKGFISQLERDLTSLSLESLLGILQALDTDIVAFFRSQENDRFVFNAADRVSTDTYPEVAEFQLMCPGTANFEMEPALVTIEPGQKIEESSHAGEEFGYVLQGRVMVEYGDRRSTAVKGECFYFVADRAHTLSNPFNRAARVLWISAPPSF